MAVAFFIFIVSRVTAMEWKHFHLCLACKKYSILAQYIKGFCNMLVMSENHLEHITSSVLSLSSTSNSVRPSKINNVIDFFHVLLQSDDLRAGK